MGRSGNSRAQVPKLEKPDGSQSATSVPSNEQSSMGEVQVKLTYFDSVYYLPYCIPLLDKDYGDKDVVTTVAAPFQHVSRIFHGETNREELERVVRSAFTCCGICGIHLNDIKEVLSHIFSDPHIGKYIGSFGPISNRDFSFWMNLLKVFNVNRTNDSIDQLRLHLSTTLDLYSRTAHLTVEVSSESEHTDALCHFVSTCFSESIQVVAFVKDEDAAADLRTVITKRFPGVLMALSARPFVGRKHLYCVYMKRSNDMDGAKVSLIFTSPPIHSRKGLDPFSILAAYSIDTCEASLILIKGSAQKTTFREFEKKFMQPQTRLVTIFDLNSLREIDKNTRINAKRRNTVHRSTPSIPLVPQSIATVPKTVPVVTSSRTTASAAQVHAPSTVTVPPAVTTVPTRSLSELEEGIRAHKACAERQKRELQAIEKGLTEAVIRGGDGVYEEQVKKMLKNIERMKIEIVNEEEKTREMKKEVIRIKIEMERTKATTVSAETMVVDTATVSSKKKKEKKPRKKVWKVTTYCIEHEITVSIPEERSEKKSVVKEIEEKKWPEIFIPFDEEMGKKVDDIIEMISSSKYRLD